MSICLDYMVNSPIIFCSTIPQLCKAQLDLATGFVLAGPLAELLFMLFSFTEYVALYTYESPEPGDLTFRVGDVILVSKREGEWWNGSIGDRTGLFPSNYVKPKETDVRTLKSYWGKAVLTVLVFDFDAELHCVA